ncbi:MAG: AMP-binding protein [SAR324 cluster bacterium]|nr:AMP-binding protein [SAR324 cluster bacterium]
MTVFEAFLESAQKYPDHEFLCIPPQSDRHYYPDGIEFSFSELRERVLVLREKYQNAGYGMGHRVALLLENRPEHIMHFLALNSLGAGIVPVNPEYRHDEMLYQMEHSEAELVVSVADRIADLKTVAVEREKPLALMNGEDLPAHFPPPSKKAQSGSPVPDTEACLFYTSGTTGRPKGCICTNFYFLNAGHWYANMGGRLHINPETERLYNPLPLFHMNAGAISLMCMMLTGGCLIIPDRFHPKSWWKEIKATDATIVHYLGVVPPLLLNQDEVPEEKQHQVKFGLGAGVEPELHDPFEERFGFPLVEIWGMTETGRLFGDHIEPRRTTTRAFGIPYGIFEAKITDEQDLEVPREQPGELLVRCAGNNPRMGFFSGYLKNEQATEEAWRGGWFHTGDVVRQGADGMLYFVDRQKNIIRRSGENIAAAEVEAVLQVHKKVAQIAVIAVPDELREEEVMACVVLMPGIHGEKAVAEDLFAWCSERLAYFKAPGWILFLDALPTTGTQKVQKTRIFPDKVDPRRQAGIFDFRQQKRKRR